MAFLPGVLWHRDGQFSGAQLVPEDESRLALYRSGKPTQNAFIESFSDSFRDKCLIETLFSSLDDTAFSYDRSVQPRPKIDPWKDQLDDLLETNAGKPKRERLTLVRVYEELRNLGYDGSYDAVRRYAANWSRETQEASAAAYVPLSFDPGEAYQFDWSHEVVLIDGVTIMV